jgi:hypothetical protein
MLRVSMSLIRSEIIPSSFYEMHKTTDSTYSIKRPQRPDLYRQLPYGGGRGKLLEMLKL